MPIDSLLVDNPFAALTSIVAPAVLTNACSVLSLGTANRIARVVDQTNRVGESLKATPKEAMEYRDVESQMRRLSVRSELLISALRLIYMALGSFAAAGLIAVIGSTLGSYSDWGFRVAAGLGLVAGLWGVGSLVVGCAKLIREVRIALEQTSELGAKALSPSA